jgi:hypothetical protein
MACGTRHIISRSQLPHHEGSSAPSLRDQESGHRRSGLSESLARCLYKYSQKLRELPLAHRRRNRDSVRNGLTCSFLQRACHHSENDTCITGEKVGHRCFTWMFSIRCPSIPCTSLWP